MFMAPIEQEVKPAGFNISARVADDPNGLPDDFAVFRALTDGRRPGPTWGLVFHDLGNGGASRETCLVSSFRACDPWPAQPCVVCRFADAANKPASSPTDADA